jgi:formylglycine-generating enzyme required for sulfatase activity
MSRTFFYKTNDRQTFGPFSTQELKGEAAQGRLNPDDTVWIDGANEIYKAKLIKGIFDSADYPQPTPVERPANNISPAIDTTVEAPVINVDPTPEVAPSSTPPPLPTQTKEWFYSKEGQQLGPYSKQEVVTQLGKDIDGQTFLVWKEGMEDWVEAATVLPLVNQTRVDRSNQVVTRGQNKNPLVLKKFSIASIIGILVIAVVFCVIVAMQPTAEQPVESITNTIGMKLKLIPPGNFVMGSPKTEESRFNDETQHKVTITKPFYMQTTEVTQGQWKSVMGTEPWKVSVREGANYPATYVSWDDAVAFCKKLSSNEGKTYRLPTEAEWEYACRAGTETRWSFGDDEKALGDYAWHNNFSSGVFDSDAKGAGLKKPNPFGLFDMHGSLYEWCHDYYADGYYKQSPEKDPQGPQDPTRGNARLAREVDRVARGGGLELRRTRSASRGHNESDESSDLYGFRVVRELD